MKKFYEWLNEFTPIVWGILWSLTITFGSLALAIWAFKWLLGLLEVW